jgi:hypothetical protein
LNHSCGVTTAGALLCWGGNDHGQIGSSPTSSPLPPTLVSTDTFVEVTAGQARSCGRTTRGAVVCWGAIWTHRDGPLEFTLDNPAPQAVPSAPSMAGISAGGFATCGFDATGFGYCWGGSPNGEGGTGTTAGSTTPLRIATTRALTSISVGLLQACAVDADGIALCWGNNAFGQLGTGSSGTALVERCGAQRAVCATAPRMIFGGQRWRLVVTGLGSHSCGLTVLHHIYCWGLGTDGQRGDGTHGYRAVVPTIVSLPR